MRAPVLARLALTLLALLLVLPPSRSRAEPPIASTPRPIVTPTAPVGTLPGHFEVSDAGTARYAIPIALPPGSGGMTPSLGLAYDSSAGNGPLGVGWSLAGVSSIARCSPNLAIDGRMAPLSFTSKDALCLDGERLILIEGVAMQPGAVYAKRHDDLARVHAIAGKACDDGLGFELRDAGDRIHTYGCREDSLVHTPRGISNWSLSRTIDRFGNAILYRYDYDDVDAWSPAGELEGIARVDHRLARIDYGGHVGAPLLAPNLHVVLNWEERPDTSKGWFAGGPTAATKRLAGIELHHEDELVRRWPLSYSSAKATGRSRLVAVTECAGDGVCKPATTFDWIEGDPSVEHVPIGGWSADAAKLPYLLDPVTPERPEIYRVTLDANGDGLSDLLAAVGAPAYPPPLGRGWELWRSQPDKIADSEYGPCGNNPNAPADCAPNQYVIDEAPRAEPMPFADPLITGREHAMFAIDVDGDGRDDAIAPANHYLIADEEFYLWAIDNLVVVHGSDLHETLVPLGDEDAPVWSYVAADFTGDGLGDVIACQPSDAGERALEIGTWRVLPNQPGVGLDVAALVDTGLRCGSYDKLHVLDHDGDGVASLLVVETWSDDAKSWLPASKWANYHALLLSPALDTFAWQDSGLPPDLAQRWRERPTQTLNVMGIAADFPRFGHSLGVDRVLDVQGDGLPDIVRYELEIGDVGPLSTQIGTIVNDSPAALEQGGLRLWINDGLRFRDGGWLTPFDALARDRFEEHGSSATLDWNGDGLLDLLMPNADTQVWDVWLSDGRGGFEVTTIPDAPHWNSSGSAHTGALSAMDVDGDALHDPVLWDFGGIWNIYRHAGEAPDRIITITDGLGQRTAIEYGSITDFELPDLHTPTTCSWPASCAERPRIVVTKHHLDAGLADASIVRTFEHAYAGQAGDRLERRGLGFASHTVTQWSQGEAIGRRTTWYANQDHDESLAAFVHAGHPIRRIEQVYDVESGWRHALLEELSYDTVATAAPSFRVVEAHRHVRSYELPSCFARFCELSELLDAAPLSETWSFVLARDELGFELHRRDVVVLDEGSETIDVERKIEHDQAAWLLGRVTHETTTAITLDEQPVARTHAFAYDPSTGVLASETDQPGELELALTTTYERDAFGNTTAALVSDALGETRSTQFEYDARGRFLIEVTNARGHVTRMHWHEALGVPQLVSDPNDVVQLVDVDGFGRPTGVRVFAGLLARGDDVSIEYLPDLQGMAIRTRVLGHGERSVLHDRLARPIAERWLGPEGLEREQLVRFDALGRVAATTLPSFVGEPSPGQDAWTYDVRGRPLEHLRADGALERWFYAGRTLEHRDFEGLRALQHFDAAGRLIESERAPEAVEHERLCFDYGPFSTLVRVRADCIAPALDDFAVASGEAPATIEHFEYDVIGRLIGSESPSQGLRSYAWTAFDELREVFDGEERLTEFEYDALGRMTARVDDEGTTQWQWDLDRIGTIATAITPAGILTSHDFDAFARPLALTQELDGETFTLRFEYDGHDRVRAVHYPQVDNLPAFAVRNAYGKDGSLVGVLRLADDQPIWKLDEVDVEGRIVRESMQNGTATERAYDPLTGDLLGIHTKGPALVQDLRYTWSEAGQLRTRSDMLGGQSELFEYDALQRLAHVTTSRGPSQHVRHFAYDTLGNLVHATDVGDYEYDTHGRLTLAGEIGQTWSEVGNLSIRTTPEATTRFGWTSFDKPTLIQTIGEEPILFEYDAEQQRVRRDDREAGRETIYAFGFYERETTTSDSGTSTIHRHHVLGRDRVVAEFEITVDEQDIVSEQTRYLHDDHLGSLDSVTDEQGQVVQRLSFDAWGKPRDPSDWTLPDEFMVESLVNRGFTGHEGQRDAGLVNMGGRLYDPVTARMVNADPHVVVPDLAIGWNRYAYVLDDPLSLTDPSGFSPENDEGGGDSGGDLEGFEDMGDSEGGGGTWSLRENPDTLEFDVHTTMAINVSGGASAGSATDAGPAVDGRGSEADADADRDAGGGGWFDLGLGLVDGVGNTNYLAMSGAAIAASPLLGAATVIGFWASGGNPASEVRQFVGDLIGSETLSADPSSGAYTAGLITGEVVSGGVAGMARGVGSSLRTMATSAVRSCVAGGCTRSGFGGRLVSIVTRSACFVAGTPVAMADGSVRPIERVEVGDEVACFDAQGPAVCVVAETSRREVARVLEVAVEDESGERSTITVTPEHPFHVVELGRWLDADDLQPGDTLLRHDGTHARVLGLEAVRGEFEVFNFESLDAHDYFAGELLVLVHNGCSKRLARNIERATGIARPDGYATHHIVAGGAKRAKPAQQVLERYGIHIDDAANGVYLPNSIEAARVSGAAYHRGLHSNAYYDKVNLIMEQSTTKEEAISRLADIAADLVQGTF